MKQYINIIWVFLAIALAVYFETPQKPKPAEFEGFSAFRAQEHLNEIAKEFHFTGTPENEKVKSYILSQFQKLGIPARVFNGFSQASYSDRYIRIAKTENIIARIPGQKSGKSIVLAGHYDSVLSAPGAADDGHAIACMLEVARLLKGQKLQNDVVFLITDGEELGMLGAKAFVESENTDSIGVLLNYEARGNSGPGIFFEWSQGNAWLVHQIQKAALKPVSNSMAYEIYKRLPNDSDFTYFKQAGIKGINHAFIDGFSYYHNPADTPENLDMRSFQHTGENMYLMAKHFANCSLENIPDDRDASFFNFYGNLVIYPSQWDLPLLILTLIFILTIVYRDWSNIGLIAILKCLAIWIGVLLSIIIINTAISYLLFTVYPQYALFYTGQYYNHKWYILVSVGIALLILYYAQRYFLKKNLSLVANKAGLILLCTLACVIYIFLPTANYLFCIPLFAILIHQLISNNLKSQLAQTFTNYSISLVPLGILGPIIITLFLAFSIKLLFVPGLIIAVLAISLSIVFKNLTSNTSLKVIAWVFIISGFLVAHLLAKATATQAIPSNLHFTYNVDSQSSHWVTNNPSTNIGNSKILKNASFQNIDLPYSSQKLAIQSELKPNVNIPQIKTDSTAHKFIAYKKDNSFRSILYIPQTKNIKSLKIDQQPVLENQNQELIIDIYGMGQDSLTVEYALNDYSIPVEFKLNTMIRKMPENQEIPENVLRTGNYSSIIQNIRIN